MRRTKIHGDKGYHTALTTIKQEVQHSGPNRSPKNNQAESKNSLLVSPRSRFDKNSENTRDHYIYTVYIYIYIYIYIYTSRCTCYIHESNMWPYLTTGQRPKKDCRTKEGFLEVVRRKPGYNAYYFLVGTNCSVRCRGLIQSYIYLNS